MFEKVILGREVKTEGGKILGKQIGGFDGRVIFEDDHGTQHCATYGIIDENGKFHAFCTGSATCGNQCKATNSPACRYNRKYQHTAGYYVAV